MIEQPAPKSLKTAPLWAGIAFSFIFTALIWVMGNRLSTIPHQPDQGPAWYYWQLSEPTFWSRASAWGLYFGHQLASWWTIYYAQTHIKQTINGLHRINWIALGINALFIVLHLFQTHLLYDGLAQDVSIFSSQGSVILLLVWVLLMENPRRGLFFGKRVPFKRSLTQAARKYHGYIFSWAAIYTFWYHPMENSSGHLIGFVYMFFLLLQGSLFFTRKHTNRWWTVALELMVLIHGTLVAFMQSGAQGFWPMFFFGFLGIFVITQMHGLGLSKAIRWWIGGVYLGLVLLVYNVRGWSSLNEIVRIPLIEYILVGVLALILGGIIWIVQRGRVMINPPHTVVVEDHEP